MTSRHLSIATLAALAAATSASASSINFDGGQLTAQYGGGDSAGPSEFTTISRGTATVVNDGGTNAEFLNFVKSSLYRDPQFDVEDEAGPSFNIDIDELTISISGFLQTGGGPGSIVVAPYYGFIFSDESNSMPSFESVSIGASSEPMVGLSQNRIGVEANQIFLNWQGLGYTSDTVVTLNVSFGGEQPQDTPAVPAPLAAPGIAVLLLVARRFRHSTISA